MHEHKDNTSVPAAALEQAVGNESMAKEQVSKTDSRVSITVVSFRKRKHDPDGVSVKAFLDGLVRAGILPDDSTNEIKSITFESVITNEEEKTEIYINNLPG